jgi:hypothetical protein
MDQGRKGAIKWTRLSCHSFAANAVRLQLHALHAHAGDAENRGAVVVDQPAREADQDRCEGRRPRTLRTFQLAEVAVSR